VQPLARYQAAGVQTTAWHNISESSAVARQVRRCFAGYQPYTRQTESNLQKLIALEPTTIAAMHGSTFAGDGAQSGKKLTTQQATEVRTEAAAIRTVLGCQ
jgi:hypothetical protein